MVYTLMIDALGNVHAGTKTYHTNNLVLHTGSQLLDIDGAPINVLRGDTNNSITGYLDTQAIANTGTGVTRLLHPDGADFAGPVAPTGAMKITLPVGYNNTMLLMTVSVYDYNSNQSFDIHISGYNYSGTTSWINTTAYITGSPLVDKNLNVRFGYDGTKCVIYIGELSDIWSYLNYSVGSVSISFNGNVLQDWYTGWSCGVEAVSFLNITSTVAADRIGKRVAGNTVWHAGNDGAGSGLDADLLDGLDSTYFRNATNLNAGTVPDARLPATITSDISGNSATTTKWRTARTITLTGDQTGSVVIDGTTNVTLTTANVPANLLADLKTVDGAGSGLDADLLDGLQASQFLRSTAQAVDSAKLNGLPASSYATVQGRVVNDCNAAQYRIPGSYGFNGAPVNGPGIGFESMLTATNSDTGLQIAGGYNSGQLYFRGWSTYGGTYYAWNKLWHNNNDGAGSGLDADLLDGIDSGSFLRSDATDYINGTLYLRNDIVTETGYRDRGIFGTYDSYKTDHIWSMSTGYRNDPNGVNFGNLYGLAYKYINNTTGGSMAGGHQMVWCQNGTPTSAMGSGVWTSGNVFAGGKVGGLYLYTGFDPGIPGSVSCNNWFRSAGATGWYNETYTGGIYMSDTTWVRTYGSKSFYCDHTLQGVTIVESSDRRLKENIKPLVASLDKIKQLKPVSYNLIKDPKNSDIGFIAQDMEEVVPEVVFTDTAEAAGMKAIDYGSLTALLASAMQEQQITITQQQQEIDTLKSKLDIVLNNLNIKVDNSLVHVRRIHVTRKKS